MDEREEESDRQEGINKVLVEERRSRGKRSKKVGQEWRTERADTGREGRNEALNERRHAFCLWGYTGEEELRQKRVEG